MTTAAARLSGPLPGGSVIQRGVRTRAARPSGALDADHAAGGDDRHALAGAQSIDRLVSRGAGPLEAASRCRLAFACWPIDQRPVPAFPRLRPPARIGGGKNTSSRTTATCRARQSGRRRCTAARFARRRPRPRLRCWKRVSARCQARASSTSGIAASPQSSMSGSSNVIRAAAGCGPHARPHDLLQAASTPVAVSICSRPSLCRAQMRLEHAEKRANAGDSWPARPVRPSTAAARRFRHRSVRPDPPAQAGLIGRDNVRHQGLEPPGRAHPGRGRTPGNRENR